MDAVNSFFESHKRTGLLIILVVSATMAVVLIFFSELRFTSYPGFSDPIDHHKYIYMAQNQFSFYIAPFCWRVGLPLLAGILPFDLQTNFLSLTYLSVVFSGVVLFYLLHRVKFSYFFSLVGILLYFAAGWIVRMPLINFWVPNGAIFLVILCCLFLIANKNDLWFMVLVAIGVCFKESALFVAPLYYTFNCRKWVDWRTALRTILLTLPAICVLLLIRFVLLPAQNDNPAYVNSLPFILTQVQDGSMQYNYIFLLKTVALRRFQNITPYELADITFYQFGALLMILPFFAIRRNLKWLAKFWPFILLVYAQLFFAVSKIGLLYLALPVLIIMAVTGLEEITRRWSVPSYLVLFLPVVTYILNLNKIDDNIDFKWLALTLMLWLALAWLIPKIFHKEKLKEQV
ncbi:MAG: hypothetical protein AB9891_16080 [Anaerolineaceae bacterium]